MTADARFCLIIAVVGVVGLCSMIGGTPDTPSVQRQRRALRGQQRSNVHTGWFESISKPAPAVATKLAAGVNVAYTPEELYKSQDGQDKWANEHVFRGMTNGKFVDFGCYDGITYSNTWYFERVLNWTGVCVEPNPEVFPRIAGQAGRASGVQLAVSDKQGTLPFVAAYMRGSLNATAVDYQFLESQGVAASTVEVEVTTPAALLAAHRATRNAPVLDYVSIDVEQLELAILRVWPFARHCVQLFNVENEPPEGSPSSLPQLKALLEPLGYEHALRIGVDEVFRRSTPCAGEERAAAAGGARRAAGTAAYGGGRHGAMPRMARQLRGSVAGPSDDPAGVDGVGRLAHPPHLGRAAVHRVRRRKERARL